jgi:hypothetical protein
MVAAIAPADRRAEALAGMFLAGYIGLSLPVVGLGVMTQYLSPRLSLLIFTAALVSGIVAATPRLLAGDPKSAAAPSQGTARRGSRTGSHRVHRQITNPKH